MPEFLWRTQESPARRIALAPLALAELGYAAGAALHRAVYARGWRARTRLDARVVSVGNLAVGGSAKTPVAAFLARELHARGRKVALLSRGFGGRRSDSLNVVSDGERVLAAPADAGDEACLLAVSAPGVPVLSGARRIDLGLRALSLFGSEVLILDDGFQHHPLVRDLDLVCLDAKLGLGNGHVLPRGPLRESARVLRRADALVFTRAEPGDPEPPGSERLPAQLPRFRVAIHKLGLRPVRGGERQPLARLRGARVGLLAAIARPDRLAADLESLGAELCARRVWSDHHGYQPRDLADLERELLWVTTAKDAVKIPPAWAGDAELVVLEEDVERASALPLVDFVAARLSG
ncbi:MAG TPA: tetraacyldisaccharide 4'-kinase [Myxococcota bacterium]|nr:tetraacyldisaccharide 4'-kinase [Myxococcota bacterium]